MKALFMAALLAASFTASNAFAVCDKTTTKDNVAAADTACDKAKKGDVCILANTPPSCGAPGAKDAACKRDKVCASGKCDTKTSKCL